MEDEYQKEFEDCMRQMYEQEQADKASWRQKLTGLINVDSLFNNLDTNDSWTPQDIVEVYEVEEKRSGYSSYQHARIKEDKDRLLYMKVTVDQDDEDEAIEGIDHTYVWQTTGILGDDFSGYALYPLNDGRYFKIHYSC